MGRVEMWQRRTWKAGNVPPWNITFLKRAGRTTTIQIAYQAIAQRCYYHWGHFSTDGPRKCGKSTNRNWEHILATFKRIYCKRLSKAPLCLQSRPFLPNKWLCPHFVEDTHSSMQRCSATPQAMALWQIAHLGTNSSVGIDTSLQVMVRNCDPCVYLKAAMIGTGNHDHVLILVLASLFARCSSFGSPAHTDSFPMSYVSYFLFVRKWAFRGLL